MNEEGTHKLVGIVSKRLGESCSQQEYAVFTSVSALLPWIESSIKENGGMASCSFNFSAPPTLGILLQIPPIHVRITFRHTLPNKKNHQYHKSKEQDKDHIKEHHWSLYLRLVSSFLEVNQQKDNSPPLKLLDLTIAQFLLYLRPVTG